MNSRKYRSEAERPLAEFECVMKANNIPMLMAKKKATSLLLQAGEYPTLRVNGQLEKLSQIPCVSESQIIAIMDEITTPKQRRLFSKEMELFFNYSIDGKVSFDIDMIKQRGTVCLSFNLIETDETGERINQKTALPLEGAEVEIGQLVRSAYQSVKPDPRFRRSLLRILLSEAKKLL